MDDEALSKLWVVVIYALFNAVCIRLTELRCEYANAREGMLDIEIMRD